MDIFKYQDLANMSNGVSVTGWDSVNWVERYREPGEVWVRARLSSGLREALPLGCLISHIHTDEIMIIEDHQILEDVETDPELVITGRSFETYLENRVIGQNLPWTTAPPPNIDGSLYTLNANNTWFQAMDLINKHVSTQSLIPEDRLPNVLADSLITGPGVEELRVIQRGPVHQRLVELLEIDDLGVRIRRPNPFTTDFSPTMTIFEIYRGVDRTSEVSFSSQNGDIESSEYLWSIRKLKNSALVQGKFVETMVYGTETGYDRRVMIVDGTDIDGGLSDIPTGTDLTTIRQKMAARGRQALAAQKQITLSRSDVSEASSNLYRQDYQVGDIVTIETNFGDTFPMRVVEYAEIVDENGQSGHPTLSLLEE